MNARAARAQDDAIVGRLIAESLTNQKAAVTRAEFLLRLNALALVNLGS